MDGLHTRCRHVPTDEMCRHKNAAQPWSGLAPLLQARVHDALEGKAVLSLPDCPGVTAGPKALASSRTRQPYPIRS
eukprot:360311-Chlamydomonas_euryale.AAC.5